MRKEIIVTVEVIPFNTFNEKINITKKHYTKDQIQIIDDLVVVTKRKISI